MNSPTVGASFTSADIAMAEVDAAMLVAPDHTSTELQQGAMALAKSNKTPVSMDAGRMLSMIYNMFLSEFVVRLLLACCILHQGTLPAISFTQSFSLFAFHWCVLCVLILTGLWCFPAGGVGNEAGLVVQQQ